MTSVTFNLHILHYYNCVNHVYGHNIEMIHSCPFASEMRLVDTYGISKPANPLQLPLVDL